MALFSCRTKQYTDKDKIYKEISKDALHCGVSTGALANDEWSITISTQLSLEQLRDVIRCIPASKLMLQTLHQVALK